MSRTAPLLTALSALALLSIEPVPLIAGVRACSAGVNSTEPLLSAIIAT